MNYTQAQKWMDEGKRIRRKSWSKDNNYWFLDKKDNVVKEGCFGNVIFEEYYNKKENDWEVVDENNWKLEKDKPYYFIESNGDISREENCEFDLNIDRFSIGNYFETEDEAQHMIEKFKVLCALKEFTTKYNVEKIDWKNESQDKYFISYIHGSCGESILPVREHPSYAQRLPNYLYFTSYDLCNTAIYKIGESRLKRYYFDM